jgi:hypothetical protein
LGTLQGPAKPKPKPGANLGSGLGFVKFKLAKAQPDPEHHDLLSILPAYSLRDHFDPYIKMCGHLITVCPS